MSLTGCVDGTLQGAGGTSASGASSASSSGSGGGSSASSGAGGHGGAAPTLTPAPFDWLGIVSTGQSLSVGATSNPVVSSAQPYHNLMLSDASPDPRYDGQGDALSLVPLTAPLRSVPGGGVA